MDYYENYNIDSIVKLIHGTKKGCFLGFNAISKIGEILDDMKPSCIGFVTSPGAYKKSGVWEPMLAAMKQRNIPYLHYDKIMTNPTIEVVDEAVALFKPKYDEKFLIISIGGGSPGDAAKSIAILLHPDCQKNNCRQLYKMELNPTKRVNLVMINITHGTGTEVDRFAVVSILTGEPHPYKPAIAYECCYPDYSINDVNTMMSMDEKMTRFTSIDALNHVTEGCSTTIATPYSCTLAREVVYLVHRYLPVVLKDGTNKRGRYWLTYAAAIAGMCFDESLLHLTHALEHTLSAYVPTLCHGQGLALIQPAVLEHIWPAAGTVIQPLFEPIFGKEKITPKQAFDMMRAFHKSVGFAGTLKEIGLKKEQVPKLVEATVACPGMKGLIALSPVPCEEKDMAKIFTSAFFE